MGEVFNRYTDTAGKFHYTDTETGTHTIPASVYEYWGKFIKDEEDESKEKSETVFPNYGWVCPVCGRGLSPYTSVCPCKGYVQGEWTVTC